LIIPKCTEFNLESKPKLILNSDLGHKYELLILISILINLFVSNKNEASVSRGASKSRNASSRGQACSDLDEEDDESTEDDETDSNDCLRSSTPSRSSISWCRRRAGTPTSGSTTCSPRAPRPRRCGKIKLRVNSNINCVLISVFSCLF